MDAKKWEEIEAVRRRREEKEGNLFSINELIKKIRKSTGTTNKNEKYQRLWEECVGNEVAEKTQVLRWKKGILDILVRSGTLYQELSSFRKEIILRAVQHEEGNEGRTQRIRFFLHDQGNGKGI